MTALAKQLLTEMEWRAYGRANALKARQLALWFGVTIRDIQAAVEELRRERIFVASCRDGAHGGLYLPTSEEERLDAIGSYRRATLTQITTYNLLKRAQLVQRREAGQMSLFRS